MTESTLVCASSQDDQKPNDELQVAQMVVGITGNLTLVSQLRTDLEPRKESTMSLLVVSVATKPVMSDLSELEKVSMYVGCTSRKCLLFKLGQGVCVGCLHASAITPWASDLCVGTIVVSKTVCRSRVLTEELKLVENVGRHRFVGVSIGWMNEAKHRRTSLLDLNRYSGHETDSTEEHSS